MSKRKMIVGVLGATMVASLLAIPASAATYNDTSDANVQFKNGTVPPITPPPGHHGPVGPSDFKLLYVPDEFNFGEIEVDPLASTNKFIDLDSNWEGDPQVDNTGSLTGTNPHTKYAAVGDYRGNKTNGWKLTAKITTEMTDGTKTLTGSKIHVKTTALNELTNTGTSLNANVTPGSGTESPDGLIAGSGAIDNVGVTIMSASKESAVGAADARGAGIWEAEMGSSANKMQLEIPFAQYKNALAGEVYSGEITWTLDDTPA